MPQQQETVVSRLLATAFGGDMDSKVLGCLAAYKEKVWAEVAIVDSLGLEESIFG